MYVLLALLLQAAPVHRPDPKILEAVQVLDEGVRNTEAGLVWLESFLQSFPKRTWTPTSGMLVESLDADAQGLHPIRVRSVFGGGPADSAGIRPGDRIMAIGPRRLEHETVTVFNILVNRDTGPVELTFRRDGVEHTVTVQRQTSDCAEQAMARSNISGWLEVVALLRKACERFHALLVNPNSWNAQNLMQLRHEQERLHTELSDLLTIIHQGMQRLRQLTCRERFE